MINNLRSAQTIDSVQLEYTPKLIVGGLTASALLSDVVLLSKSTLTMEGLLSTAQLDSVNFGIASGLLFIASRLSQEYSISTSLTGGGERE